MDEKLEIRKPIESHKTAAWANAEKTKRLSGVAIPNDYLVEFAKEYVDENQK